MNLHLTHVFRRKTAFLLKILWRRLRPGKVLPNVGTAQGLGAVYVINLDRQPLRWQHMLRETKRQRVTGRRTLAEFCHRLPAIDGGLLRAAEVSPAQLVPQYALRTQYYVDPEPRLLPALRAGDPVISMSAPEMAVALSHVAAWQRLLAEGHAYALILEDDGFFERDFSRLLPRLWQELPTDEHGAPSFDFLYLSYRAVDRGAETVAFSPHLMRPVRGLWWFSGYVISRAGAEQLLARLPICGPVDLWINLHFSSLRVYASVPSLIFQRNDLTSDNAYSIMPYLSQLGIQADQTHAELQQRKGRGPVFVLTGSSADHNWLAAALSVLGYRCCLDDGTQFTPDVHRRLAVREPLLFDAYLGIAGLGEQQELLAQLYPAAVFISMDPPAAASARPAAHRLALRRALGRLPGRAIHHGQPGKHLLLPAEGISWQALCWFLKCEVPAFGLPQRANLPSVPPYAIRPVQQSLVGLRRTTYPEHDVTPWIIPLERLAAHGIESIAAAGRQVGEFTPLFYDDFASFHADRWRLLQDSFPSNLAAFTPDNFHFGEPKGCRLRLCKQRMGIRQYTSASLVSRASYLYGRFEVRLKAVRLSGVITAFFLHRNDPWQELDMEFLGQNTSQVLLNVYFNPGSQAGGWNYGNRGTPVLVELGFDASAAFHTYAIEWEPHEIRWFADGELLHVRPMWAPTPVPALPMQFFMNLWPSRSEELAGPFDEAQLPVEAQVEEVTIAAWSLSAGE